MRVRASTIKSIATGSQVIKACVFAAKGERHHADGAVTLFADDDFGLAFVGGIAVVDLVAVDEQDQIGILLDSTRFAQI